MDLYFRKLIYSDIIDCIDIVKKNYTDKDISWSEILPKDLSDVLSKKYPSECLVVAKDKTIVGFGCWVKDKVQENIFTLTWINILPLEQNKGIGKKLIYELEKNIKGKYYYKEINVVLETDKPYFYLKIGYKTFARNGNNDMMIKII